MTRDLYTPCDPYPVTEPPVTGTAIGRDLGALIVVLSSGAVVASAEGRVVIPINSSLDQYRNSLTAVAEARDRLAADPEDEDLVDRLEIELRRFDADAYAAPGGYWPTIVEQIRNQQF